MPRKYASGDEYTKSGLSVAIVPPQKVKVSPSHSKRVGEARRRDDCLECQKYRAEIQEHVSDKLSKQKIIEELNRIVLAKSSANGEPQSDNERKQHFIYSLQAEVERCQTDFARLQLERANDLRDLSHCVDENKQLKKQLEQDKEDHAGQIKQLTTSHKAELDQVIYRFESTVSSLHFEIDAVRQEFIVEKRHKDEIEAKLKRAITEREQVAVKRNQDLRQQKMRCEKEIARLEEALEDKKTVIAEMCLENDMTLNKLKEEKTKELEQLTKDYQYLQNANDKLQKEMARLQSECSIARERWSKAEGDKENIKSELTQMFETEAIERNRLDVTHCDEMKRMKEHHDAEVRKLERDRAVKQSDLATKYEHQVNRLRTENTKAVEGLKDGHQHELTDIKAKCEKEIARLEEALEDKKTVIEKMCLENDVTLNKLKEEKTKELEQLTRDYQYLQNANDKHRKETSKLQTKLAQADEVKARTADELKQMKQTHDSEMSKLKGVHAEEMKKLNTRRQEEIDYLQSECLKAKKEAEEAKSLAEYRVKQVKELCL